MRDIKKRCYKDLQVEAFYKTLEETMKEAHPETMTAKEIEDFFEAVKESIDLNSEIFMKHYEDNILILRNRYKKKSLYNESEDPEYLLKVAHETAAKLTNKLREQERQSTFYKYPLCVL